MKLSKLHYRILEECADGHCYRGVWRWTLKDGTPVTRQITTLRRWGLIDCMYFTGGRASASPTDAGRNILEKRDNA